MPLIPRDSDGCGTHFDWFSVMTHLSKIDRKNSQVLSCRMGHLSRPRIPSPTLLSDSIALKKLFHLSSNSSVKRMILCDQHGTCMVD